MTQKDSPISVRKNNGELVLFDPAKLKEALERSGAETIQINRILSKVREELYDGIPTSRIYRLAYDILRRQSDQSAGRYRLKKALLQIGPSGYPFEHFMGKLFESQGYKFQTGQIIQGSCVQHEVDVIAENSQEVIMAECKFHRSEGAKSDVKISLYVRARYTDIANRRRQDAPDDTRAFIPMLITNTKFTEDAIRFGVCSGLKLLSWDYPMNNGLKDWIDRSGLFPITVLKSLQKKEAEMLLNQGIVLCSELHTNIATLQSLHIPPSRIKKITVEIENILKTKIKH